MLTKPKSNDRKRAQKTSTCLGSSSSHDSLTYSSSTSSSPRTPFGPFLKLRIAGSNSSSKKIINYAYGYNSIRSKKNWNDSQKDRSKSREGISKFLRNSKASKACHTHCKIFPKPKKLKGLTLVMANFVVLHADHIM